MLKNILVGLDGSADGWAGADLAFRWAARSGAAVIGLGVVDEPGIRSPEMAPIGGESFKEPRDAAIMARARRKVEEFLDEFRRRAVAAGVPVRAMEVLGDPHARLVAEAQRFDLIVLGRETHFHFATRAGADSTLQRVLRDAPRPVVAVPAGPLAGAAVVIAYDGSLQSARAVHAFRASGLAGPGPVHLVAVGDATVVDDSLGRAAEYLASHGIAATPHAVRPAGSVGHTLLETARGLDAGLLVMGAYGKSAVREFFLGSVTRTALKESTVPLFLFH